MSDKICNVGASKSTDDGVCDTNNMLQNMSMVDNKDNDVSICANCDKEGANNVCNKCKQVKYCNAACKKKHRHKHKKECEENVSQAAERAAKLHDEELFKQPPPKEDCPICFLRLPTLRSGSKYYFCCGKIICGGCMHAPVYDDQGNEVTERVCPFCRVPHPKTNEEEDQRLKKRVDAGDAEAIFNLGYKYGEGLNGLQQNMDKAFELWHRAAAELGYDVAYCNIGIAYEFGQGVEVDKKKANHYYELSAMGGNEVARYNLGVNEENAGNMDRALKHYIIAVKGGDSESLGVIQELYTRGCATKEDYTKALQSYQTYLGEIKSV